MLVNSSPVVCFCLKSVVFTLIQFNLFLWGILCASHAFNHGDRLVQFTTNQETVIRLDITE